MATELLPTVEGYVHGIVALDPPAIQCDGCGYVYTYTGNGGLGWAIISSAIIYNISLYGHGDDRRLCRECRAAEWDE